MPPLNLPCGKDLNHLRIQLSEGLNLTALIDHLETCDKCSRCQGKLVRELNGLIGGGEARFSTLYGICTVFKAGKANLLRRHSGRLSSG